MGPSEEAPEEALVNAFQTGGTAPSGASYGEKRSRAQGRTPSGKASKHRSKRGGAPRTPQGNPQGREAAEQLAREGRVPVHTATFIRRFPGGGL